MALALALMGAGRAGAEPAIQIHPSLTARVTYSDVSRSDDDRRDEGSRFIGELAPGLAISMPRDGGRVHGRLDVQLRNVLSTDTGNDENRSRSFFTLRGGAEVEAIRRLLFFDLDASVSRGNRSAFSQRAPGDYLDTDETSESRVYSFSPRLEFRVGGADGTVRYERRWFDSGATGFSRQGQERWNARLDDPNPAALFGWTLIFDHTESTYVDRDPKDKSEVSGRAILHWNVTNRFRVNGIVGRESNNYRTVDIDEDNTIVGVGFDWNPSPRTRFSATTEKRAFGRSYDVRFNHRRALSGWQLSYTRDISSVLRPLSGALWDDLYQQVFDELAVIEPDPIRRDALVRDRLDELGIPTDRFSEGFITNLHFVERKLRAVVSLMGVRNLVTVSAYRSEREGIDSTSTGNAADDLANFSQIKQLSTTVSWTHRLSGITAFNMGVSRLISEGSRGLRGDPDAETRRWVARIGLTTRLGAHTVGSLGYRYQRASGTTDFRENAIMATLQMTF